MTRQIFVLHSADDAGQEALLLWRADTFEIPQGRIDPMLLADQGTAYLSRLRGLTVRGDGELTDTMACQFRISSSINDSGTGAGPEMSARWEQSPVAITISAGGRSITLPGPAAAGVTGRDTSEPYDYEIRRGAEWAAFVAHYVALPFATQEHDTRLILDDGRAAAGATPMSHIQAILSADDRLPPIFPHVYRGGTTEPAIVLTALGGEGIVGIGLDARRNIDSIRIEARAGSYMAAEAILERAIGIIRRDGRTVSVDGTFSDYDSATEIYRAFATADIRRGGAAETAE